jgi:hypothetical protein
MEENVRIAIMLVPLALMACGGSSSVPAAITLRPAGADPTSISVMGGAQLQFANADSIDHRIASSDCAELSSPTLPAGASFTATMGAGPKTCSFDDALQPSAAPFQGTVTVEPSTGGSDAGYGNPYGP